MKTDFKDFKEAKATDTNVSDAYIPSIRAIPDVRLFYVSGSELALHSVKGS